MTYKPVDLAIIMTVGPCIDDTDFKSLEESIAYNAAGMDISLIVEKTDGTTTVTPITLTTGGANDWTHKDGGYYEVEITAAQNIEEGIAFLRGICTGVLPFESPRYDIEVANVYDSLRKGTDVLQTDAIQISGDATAANNAELAFDGTGYGFANCIIPVVTTLTGHTVQTGDSFARIGAPVGVSISADLVAIEAYVDELESRLTAVRAGYLDNLSAGAVALASGVDLVKIHGVALTETVNGYLAAAFTKLFDVATPLLVASEVMRGTENAAPAATALSDAVWTNAKAAYLDAAISSRNATTPPTVVAIRTEMEGVGYKLALIEADTNELQTNQGNWLTATGFSVPNEYDTVIAALQTDIDAILLDTSTNGVVVASGSKTGYALTAIGADLILKDSTFALAIADAVADEEYTGATHNITNSLARRVREIGAFAIHAGTAQAGAINSITLAATADANDGVYNRNLIILVDNTGVNQTRTIVDYNGTTKIAIIDRDWRISPDATTAYQITPDNTPLVVDQGIAQAGTSTTITLRSYASAINDNYLCNIVIIIAGTGRGQARLVGSYVGSTKVVTICGDNWITIPDNTSVYAMIPYGATCASCMNDYALDQINTVCDTALTDYDSPTRAEATTDKNAIITEIDANETKIDALQTDLTAIKAKTDSLPSGPAKNVALPKFDFLMVLSSDGVTGATGKTVTGEIMKDGTAFAALTNSITEVSDGMYAMLAGLTQAEMNADVFTLKFSATDCLNRIITVHTT